MTRPRGPGLRRVAAALAVAGLLLAWGAAPAWADNCGTPSDCFGTAGSFTRTAWGLIVLSGLSLVLDLLPGVGTVKGGIEAATGRDLLTGQQLAPWERALAIVPGVGALGAIGGVARAADNVADATRAADTVGDAAGVGRRVDNAAGTAGSATRGWDAADHPDLAGLPQKPTPNRTVRDRYEIAQTGPDNYLFRDGGEQVWADGYRAAEQALLEAKYVTRPGSSPFVEGSSVPPLVRDKIVADVENEFRRYAAVINDPATTPRMLEVVTNSEEARPFFEQLLRRYGIPGRVVVVP